MVHEPEGLLIRCVSGEWMPLDTDDIAALMHAYWPGEDTEAPRLMALAQALEEAVKRYREVR